MERGFAKACLGLNFLVEGERRDMGNRKLELEHERRWG